jgi:hypothetical protein
MRSSRAAHLAHLLMSRKKITMGEENAAHSASSYSVADRRRDGERE